jgi:hypothetical protein
MKDSSFTVFFQRWIILADSMYIKIYILYLIIMCYRRTSKKKKVEDFCGKITSLRGL